jgi:hypothetical protein
LTPLVISGRAIAAASLVLALGGCGLFKDNEKVEATVNGRVIGMPAGEFFDRYGPANARRETSDGGASYEWASSVPAAAAGTIGLDERVCKLRLGVDKQGRVSAVQIVSDPQGTKSKSRCGEIFAELKPVEIPGASREPPRRP